MADKWRSIIGQINEITTHFSDKRVAKYSIKLCPKTIDDYLGKT